MTVCLNNSLNFNRNRYNTVELQKSGEVSRHDKLCWSNSHWKYTKSILERQGA